MAFHMSSEHKRLLAEIERLRAMVQELADELEAEVKARSKGELARRIERDLEPVERARRMLAGE